jgi:hypothetical protein
MVDFGEMSRRAKMEAEARSSSAAIESAEKSDVGTIVLQKSVLPVLRKAHEEIAKSKTGIICSVESKFEVKKSQVVLVCVATPLGDADRSKPETLSLRLYFESDGTTIYARLPAKGSDPEQKWNRSVRDAEELIETAVEAQLVSFHNLLRART